MLLDATLLSLTYARTPFRQHFIGDSFFTMDVRRHYFDIRA